MKSDLSRRKFIKKTSTLCAAGCCLMAANPLRGMSFFTDSEVPDPKELCYCGYKCPDDCKFMKASVMNDTALKREVYEKWEIKKRHGVEFEPDKLFCFGCKNTEKPEGIVLTKCTVRSCAMERGYECCIECDELATCQQDLWTRFPDFKKYVDELQQKFKDAV